MPLHVDRTSIQTHQSRGEHVLELAAARARQAAGPDAVAQQDDASPVLRLVGVATQDTGDVASIDEAEKLIRSILGGGVDKALNAHSPLDADRVSALLAG
jgi:hypothetical protein